MGFSLLRIGMRSYYGGGYGYPTKVVIVESGYHGPVYGKRAPAAHS